MRYLRFLGTEHPHPERASFNLSPYKNLQWQNEQKKSAALFFAPAGFWIFHGLLHGFIWLSEPKTPNKSVNINYARLSTDVVVFPLLFSGTLFIFSTPIFRGGRSELNAKTIRILTSRDKKYMHPLRTDNVIANVNVSGWTNSRAVLWIIKFHRKANGSSGRSVQFLLFIYGARKMGEKRVFLLGCNDRYLNGLIVGYVDLVVTISIAEFIGSFICTTNSMFYMVKSTVGRCYIIENVVIVIDEIWSEKT